MWFAIRLCFGSHFLGIARRPCRLKCYFERLTLILGQRKWTQIDTPALLKLALVELSSASRITKLEDEMDRYCACGAKQATKACTLGVTIRDTCVHESTAGIEGNDCLHCIFGLDATLRDQNYDSSLPTHSILHPTRWLRYDQS
jgi:hypothetical protein